MIQYAIVTHFYVTMMTFYVIISHHEIKIDRSNFYGILQQPIYYNDLSVQIIIIIILNFQYSSKLGSQGFSKLRKFLIKDIFFRYIYPNITGFETQPYSGTSQRSEHCEGCRLMQRGICVITLAGLLSDKASRTGGGIKKEIQVKSQRVLGVTNCDRALIQIQLVHLRSIYTVMPRYAHKPVKVHTHHYLIHVKMYDLNNNDSFTFYKQPNSLLFTLTIQSNTLHFP